MASEAQLPLDPAGRLQFSWGSCDRGWKRGGWGERRDFAGAGGGVGSKEAGAAARGMTDGLAEVNAKAINPTSGWPQAPIKFIYIFTLRPPLKHLCLDFFKSSVTRPYIPARTSHPDHSKSRLTSSCLNFPLKALSLNVRFLMEFPFSTVWQLHLQRLGRRQGGILVLKHLLSQFTLFHKSIKGQKKHKVPFFPELSL